MKLSMRSCSAPSSATKARRSCGITTAPSSSQTMTSPGKMAQPPQPIGSCQPTKVSPLTDAGAAVPAHHTGSLEASTPALSRTTPSVTSAVTLRFIMRMVRMSPKMPAEVTPIASATAMQPAGISSMAPRVETGLAQLSGVARSSRTGTKRSVKAGPTSRRPLPESGLGPSIQHRRMPFFRSMVVMVPVLTRRSLSNRSALIGDLVMTRSGRQDAEPFIAPAQPRDERNRQQNHPRLADDLAEEEFKRAKGKQEEDDRVDDDPGDARDDHRGDQAASRQRRIDGEIGELGHEESRRRRDDER